jgi:hypothetical protein
MLAAASVLVSACSASAETTATEATEPPAPTSTTAGIVVASTTTSTESSTTTTATTTTKGVEVLLPANDVDDPTEAIVAIFDYVSYLATTPENARDLLHYAYAESCDCYERLLADFDTYVQNGWIQDDEGIRVAGVEISQEFANAVLLEVTYSWSPQYVATVDGDLIRLAEDEWNDRVSLIGLDLGVDKRWRVGVIGIIGESP